MRLLPCLLALTVFACAAQEQTSPPALDAPAEADGELWRGVDFRCERDADCEIKNVGNCCGYYPACVHRDSPTFPERVQAQCQAAGLASVCGFPDLAGCTCVEGRCQGVTPARISHHPSLIESGTGSATDGGEKCGLARISHTPPAATADPSAVARAAPSAGLDVVSTTPSPVFSPRRAPQRRLDALATEWCEKRGLGGRLD